MLLLQAGFIIPRNDNNGSNDGSVKYLSMLNIKNITKSVTNKLLFEDISFKLSDNQKVGFVGPNGTGKTTLLKIIAELEIADQGSVQISNDEIIGYLPQKINLNKEFMIYEYLVKSLKYEWEDYKLSMVLSKAGLGQIDQTLSVSNLSGGQKMKLGLAKILLLEPTILLLDEPTNNLDLQSILWLEKFVKNFEGKVLLVSHDRSFLDNCVDKIIELDPFTHKINEYGGNYSYYVEEKKRRKDNIMADYKVQQKKEQQMTDWIKEKQEQLKYHPNNKVARQLQSMKTRLKREVSENRIDKPQDYKSFKVNNIANNLHSKKYIFSVENFNINNLLNCKKLHVFARDRIILSGKNGSGKTTFIKSILGINKKYDGKVEIGQNIKMGYFSQEHELLDIKKTVLDNFIERSSIKSESNARKILGSFLFKGDKVFSLASLLSEGEKARLIFAMLITQKNDFLFLDEPTNHLDLESCDVIEKSLSNYEGGFLVVSHDRYFLKNIGINRKIEIKNSLISEMQ